MESTLAHQKAASPEIFDLFQQLSNIRGEMIAMEGQFAQELHLVHRAHQESARNLLHYMALRRHDLI